MFNKLIYKIKNILKLEEELHIINNKIIDLENLNTKLYEKLLKCKEIIISDRDNIKQKENKIIDLENLNSKLYEKVLKCKEIIINDRDNIKQKENKIIDLENVNLNLNKELLKFKDNIKQKEDRITDLENLNSKLYNDLSKIKEEINLKNIKISKLEDVLDNFKDVISISDEISRRKDVVLDINNQISLKKTQLFDLEQEYEIKNKSLEKDFSVKFNSLNNDYQISKNIYDKLNKEISSLEENVSLISYGFYKPHFSFDSSEEFKEKIENERYKQKTLIQYGDATICNTSWYVGNSLVEGEKMTKKYSKLMLRAFNGECDANILKVRWDNIIKMEERINSSYNAINKLGSSHQIYINNEYLSSKIAELRLTYEYKEKKYQEKQEQRRIQEQIREEEKVQKEIDDALKQAKEEEIKYQNAIEKVKIEIEKANGTKLAELNKKIIILEQRLSESRKIKERAISRAQLTKSGFVYIISNIGAFGENYYKIGMTRRLEPMDRIRELGGASVPFNFDVHAMIYSDNAPELEKTLHNYLNSKRVNMVNLRKEFFNVSIDEILEAIKNNKLDVDFIKLPEAKEYKESLVIKNNNDIEFRDRIKDDFFPISLI